MRNLLLVGLFLVAFAARSFAQTPPFYVQDVREILHFPRPNNNGKVLGHDGGGSVLFNGTSYWFFADTIWDASGNGFYDYTGDGFIGLSTLGMTTDLVADDGVDLSYKQSGGVAQGLFPATALHADECLLWAGGAVNAASKLYFYGGGVKKDALGNCAGGAAGIDIFLAQLDTTTLNATRLGTMWPVGTDGFGAPFNVSEPDGCGGQIKWVYLVGGKNLTVPGGYSHTGFTLARVTEANIENPAQYQYWDGTAWVTNSPNSAAPVFDEYFASQAQITFNPYLDRYLAVYTCNVASKICARTTTTTGSAPAALVGGWSAQVELYTCPGGDVFNCYLPTQHPEFGNGQTIYVSSTPNSPYAAPCTADADCQCSQDPAPADTCQNPGPQGRCTNLWTHRRYETRLRAITLGTTPPPAGRVLVDAGRDYSPLIRSPKDVAGHTPPDNCPTGVQGQNGWSYRRLAGSTFTDLSYDYLWSWRGPDSVSGYPAPLVNQDEGFPSDTGASVRVWQAPGAGTVRMSGEVRKLFSCGDTAGAKIILIRGGAPFGSPLWQPAVPLAPATRSALYDVTTTVAAGDAIGFVVEKGGSSAACDNLYFAPTITFTP